MDDEDDDDDDDDDDDELLWYGGTRHNFNTTHNHFHRSGIRESGSS